MGLACTQERVATLDVGATVHLLASYGRLDDLMHYATFRQACSYVWPAAPLLVVAVSTVPGQLWSVPTPSKPPDGRAWYGACHGSDMFF